MTQLMTSADTTAVEERTVGQNIGQAVVASIWADTMLEVRQIVADEAFARIGRITRRFERILDELRAQYTSEKADLATLVVQDLRSDLIECFAAARRNLSDDERIKIGEMADKIIKRTLDEIATLTEAKPSARKKSS